MNTNSAQSAPALRQQIARMQSMAAKAIQEYGDETAGGGEPAYPAWADDLKEVCKAATAALDDMPVKGNKNVSNLSVDQIMSKVQEFASTWATVGGRFDDGTAMERAEACKAEIRTLLVQHGAPATVRNATLDQAANFAADHIRRFGVKNVVDAIRALKGSRNAV